MSASRRGVVGALLAASAFAPFARAGVHAEGRARAPACTARPKSFGAALRFSELQAEPALRAAVIRDCDRLTPEVHMMWKALEPEPGRYDFAEMDELVAFARTHGLGVHGHALLWHDAVPAWGQARLRQERDWSLVAGHFGSTLDRYAADVASWTVVNEPLAPDPSGSPLRSSPFLRAFGSGYVERALREAHARAPQARLFINEYGLDYENPVEQGRRRALLALVDTLKRAGAPIHGVGVQAHLDLSKGPIDPDRLRGFLAELAALEVEIAITELDVQEKDFDAPLEVRDRRVATEVAQYLEVALDQPAVSSVTCWGLTDRHSWLPGAGGRIVAGEAVEALPRRYNRGLPYDAELQPKPLYWALRQSLAASRLTA